MTEKQKILVLDVETAPLESYTWGTWKQNVGVEQIKTESSILSFAAKWVGKAGIIYRDTGGRGKKRVRDDKALVGALHKLLDEADIIVAQNGKRFDIKRINARLIMHGHGPYSPIRVVDTWEVAKKYFGFTSNKLEWQAKHLTDSPKSAHKKFPGFELWLQCLADNPKAWAEMKKYNIQDVRATEKLYLRQRAWIGNHPNISHGHSCPKCSSSKVTKAGFKVTNAGLKYQRYQCQACGGWSQGKQLIESTAERKAKLVNA